MKSFFLIVLLSSFSLLCAFSKSPSVPEWVKAAEEGSTKKLESALKVKGRNKIFVSIQESESEENAMTLSKINAYREVFLSINRVAPLLSDDENCEAVLGKKDAPLLLSSFGIYQNAKFGDEGNPIFYKALFVTPYGVQKINGEYMEVSQLTPSIFMQCELFKDFFKEENVRLETYCTQIQRGEKKIYRAYSAVVLSKEYYTSLVTTAISIFYGKAMYGDELVFQQSFLSLLHQEFPDEHFENADGNDVSD